VLLSIAEKKVWEEEGRMVLLNQTDISSESCGLKHAMKQEKNI
jgi:hypothetical protein